MCAKTVSIVTCGRGHKWEASIKWAVKEEYVSVGVYRKAVKPTNLKKVLCPVCKFQAGAVLTNRPELNAINVSVSLPGAEAKECGK